MDLVSGDEAWTYESDVPSAAGAIVVEWNIKGSYPGAAGMWDSYIRYVAPSIDSRG